MITIGMAAYGNPEQVWFTVQGLRMYQDVKGCEILVLDNQGNEDIKKAARDCKVRYEEMSKPNGTGPARNAIFKNAIHPFVLIIDSHVFLWPDAISKLKWWLMNNWDQAINLIQGPMVLGSLQRAYTYYNNEWRSEMWGTWPKPVDVEDLSDEPTEIEMMGCGLFGCRKDSWLGFHKDCKGFDGVEGVIHAKYRKANRKVLSLPFLKWVHKFGTSGGYPVILEDKIRNFLLGFKEIGLDSAPIYKHFGEDLVSRIAERLNDED